MSGLPLWDAATAAAVDRHSMGAAIGMSSPVLMERAALACAHELLALRAGSDLPVVAVCGPGNNGGDGLAIARILHGWGLPVSWFDAAGGGNEARTQQRTLASACGVPECATLPRAAVMVDACLGTGSRGAPHGRIADAIAAMHGCRGPTLAVDLPSGVDCDDGSIAGVAVRADVTVTFGASKIGLHVTPGRDHTGRVVVADIGLRAAADTPAIATLLAGPSIAAALAGAPTPRHKGERGHLGLLGGAADTPGAVLLAATAGFRAGAGLVTVACDDAALRAAVIAARPEIMLAPRRLPAVPAADALVVGCGLTDAAAIAGLQASFTDDPRPAVWDASALQHLGCGVTPAGARVLTPHPGEAARMLASLEPEAGWTSQRVQASRIDAVRRLARATASTVVLKGAGTLIADPDRLAVASLGDASLATAGSGDVLAGIIAARLVHAVDAFTAACEGVMIHAAAGSVAGRRHAHTMAGDVVAAIDDARSFLASAAAHAALPSLRLA